MRERPGRSSPRRIPSGACFAQRDPYHLALFCPARDRAHASVAQLAEPLICNQAVVGSSPTAGSDPERASRGGRPESPRAVPWQRDKIDETGARRADARRDPNAPRARSGSKSGGAASFAALARARTGHPSPRSARSFLREDECLREERRAAKRRDSDFVTGPAGRRTPGRIPERPKGSDCKSDGSAFTGSNPVPPTTLLLPPLGPGPVSSAATPRDPALSPGADAVRRPHRIVPHAGVVQW